MIEISIGVLKRLNDAARRYEWIRKNPAFETEAFLSGLTPEEYDALVDSMMGLESDEDWDGRKALGLMWRDSK